MKTTAYVFILYGLIVLLSGISSFRFLGYRFAYIVESLAGIFILLGAIFLLLEKKPAMYLLCFLSLLLTIFYGYFFYSTTMFFPGLLTAVSFFTFITTLINLFKIVKIK
jgi:hypothetical protein